MNQSIKYIGYYSTPEITPKRSVPLAGRNKMDYTSDVLVEIIGRVDIISLSGLQKDEPGCGGCSISIGKNKNLRLFPMFGNKNRFYGRINHELTKLRLFLFLIFNVKKGEPILVYHSLAIIRIILLAKKIIGFKLILELNEIYSDVNKKMEKYRKFEYKIINVADAFLFPNDLMPSMFNKRNLPYVIEYGTYKLQKKIGNRFDDGKIHVVYAGTLDTSKGGAAAAAAAAEYLSGNYHIHLLGFGSVAQKNQIVNMITDIQAKSDCIVTYDGTLDGELFLSFLQKCHIGLSTQNPNAKFNDTSFPSKILTYLANGLQVVSVDIPVISKSELKKDITFYRNQTPEEIATAIISVKDFSPKHELLSRLDKRLKTDLTKLLCMV